MNLWPSYSSANLINLSLPRFVRRLLSIKQRRYGLHAETACLHIIDVSCYFQAGMKITSERTDRHINNMEAAHTSSFSTGAAASTLPPGAALRARVLRFIVRRDHQMFRQVHYLSSRQPVRLSVCPWRALTYLVTNLPFKVTQMMMSPPLPQVRSFPKNHGTTRSR